MDLSLRISTHAPAAGWLAPRETAAACIAASLSDGIRELTLGALFSGRVSRSIAAGAPGVRVNSAELLTLFDGLPRTSADIEAALESSYTRGVLAKLQKALRCTLDEPGPAAKWARPSVRAQVALACHTDDYEHLASKILGGFVSADARRLEELVADTQDTADPLAVADYVLALAGAS